jgi:hypothetical protein
MGMFSQGSPQVHIYTERADRSGTTRRTFKAASPEAEPVQTYMGRDQNTGRSIRKNGDGQVLSATPDLTARPTRKGGGSVEYPTRIGAATRDAKGRFTGSRTLVDDKAPEGERLRVWEGRPVPSPQKLSWDEE